MAAIGRSWHKHIAVAAPAQPLCYKFVGEQRCVLSLKLEDDSAVRELRDFSMTVQESRDASRVSLWLTLWL